MTKEKAEKKLKEEEIFEVDFDPFPIYAISTFQPDEDDWKLEKERALKIHKIVNLFCFVRKAILPNNLEKFKQNLEKVTLRLDKLKSKGKMPSQWTAAEHDRTLLVKLCENG